MLLTAFILSVLPVIYGELVVTLAVLLFRHGDRTPIDFYPTDPWANQSYWPVRFGELTPTGVKQHYALGQWLRERYSDLLSDDYDPVQITVMSTDIDRTLMSAQANLAGLFPPKGIFLWNPKVPWQPIPVHTVPYNQDEILSMGRNCSAYNKELSRFTSTAEFKKTLHSYQGLMEASHNGLINALHENPYESGIIRHWLRVHQEKNRNYLTASTGRIVKDYKSVEYVFNNLLIESLYNYTLPNWTHSVYPEKMIVPATYNFVLPTATPLLARLRVGPLLKQIATKMKEVAEMRSPTKMLMYSAHDDTVAAVLNSLGLFQPASMPAYTATVIMELLNDNKTGGNYVRISYRDSAEIVEPEILSIPYCGQTCPLERFLQLYRNLVTFGDWSTECEPQFPHFLGMSFYVGLGLIFVIYMCHRTFLPGLYTRTGASFGYSSLRRVDPEASCTVKTTIVMHS